MKAWFIVDHNELLVMGPVEGHVPCILENVVIGMAKYVDVAMALSDLQDITFPGHAWYEPNCRSRLVHTSLYTTT